MAAVPAEPAVAVKLARVLAVNAAEPHRVYFYFSDAKVVDCAVQPVAVYALLGDLP